MKSSSYSGAARPRKRTGARPFRPVYAVFAAGREPSTVYPPDGDGHALEPVSDYPDGGADRAQRRERDCAAAPAAQQGREAHHGHRVAAALGCDALRRGCRELRPVRAEQDRRQDDGDGDHRGARHER